MPARVGTGHMNIVLQPTSICNPPSPGPTVCLLKRGHVSTWLIRRPPIEEGNPSLPPPDPKFLDLRFSVCVCTGNAQKLMQRKT